MAKDFVDAVTKNDETNLLEVSFRMMGKHKYKLDVSTLDEPDKLEMLELVRRIKNSEVTRTEPMTGRLDIKISFAGENIFKQNRSLLNDNDQVRALIDKVESLPKELTKAADKGIQPT